MIAFSGVRSSWDMFARKALLCWLASSSCAALVLQLPEQVDVLFERLGQLMRPLDHFLLQAGVRLAELLRHMVEGVRERLQLVACPHRNLLVERACPDALGALLERSDRRHHATGQDQACRDRESQA